MEIERARELAESASKASRLDVFACLKRRLFKVKGMEFSIADGGCACSLLDEGADWYAPVWKMKPEGRLKLFLAVKELARGLNQQFYFEALFSISKARYHQPTTLEQLLQRIEMGQLQNFTRYHIANENSNYGEQTSC